jgi:hypothetical protein
MNLTTVELNCIDLTRGLSDYGRHLCNDFTPTFEDFQARFESYKLGIVERYNVIAKLLPTPVRHKRGAPIVAAGIAAGVVVGITSAFIQNSRLKALEKSVIELERRQYVLDDSFLDLSTDMITVTQLAAKDIEILFGLVEETNKKLNSVALDLLEFGSVYNRTMYEFSNRFHGIRLFSKIVARIIRLMTKVDKGFEDLISNLDGYGNAIVSLLHGHLPREILSPIVLSDILNHAAEQIYAIEPDYTLTFTDIDHYYSFSDLVYSVRDNHLVVVLPLTLRLRSQQTLNLYRLESVPVPVNMSDIRDPPKDYTKIVFNFDYFAVLKSDFVELTNSVLDSCLDYNGLRICEETILQIHKSKLTCASAIYADRDVEIVNKLCTMDYYPSFAPTARILESDQSVLLANVGTDWRFTCSASNVPQRFAGHPYSVLNISAFCHCSLSSDNYFISQRITGCDSALDKLKLKYVVNALFVSAIIDSNSEILKQINVNSLFDSIPHLLLPNMSIDSSEPLRLNAPTDLKNYVNANTKYKKYWREKHIDFETKRIVKWYEHEVVAIFNTCVSFTVLILVVVVLYVCFKQHKLAIMLPFLTSPNRAAALHSMETCDFPIVSCIWMFAMFLMSFIIYKMACTFCKRFTAYRAVCGKNSIDSLKIQLQIISTKDVVEIDLLTIQGRLVDIAPDNYIRVKIANVQVHLLYALMTLEIEHNILKLFCSTSSFTLPTAIYVNVFLKNRLMRITEDTHACRLVINDGISTVIIGRASLQELWET